MQKSGDQIARQDEEDVDPEESSPDTRCAEVVEHDGSHGQSP
jgi:hypothetical protein